MAENAIDHTNKYKEAYLNAKSVYEMFNSEYEKLIQKATYLIPVATFIAGGFLILLKDIVPKISFGDKYELLFVYTILMVSVTIIIVCSVAIINILCVLKLGNFEIVVFNERDLLYVQNDNITDINMYQELIAKYINANSKNRDLLSEKAKLIKAPQRKLIFSVQLIIGFILLYAAYLIYKF
ncbi:MAG: hypothetical protein JSS63_03620 [Bacteroidetes bacterium]|nr:hypothetical protein [Bacteroidota bacterium]